jgi:signal transduction histidine kinase
MSPRRATTVFVLTSLLAVFMIGFASVEVLRNQGRTEAVADAEDLARLAGRGAVQPALSDALLRGGGAAIAAVDRAVRSSVLGNGIVRVKIWTRSGRIVYSDAAPLIGESHALHPGELKVMATGRVAAEQHSNPANPQNRFERRLGSLLEIYLPLRTPSGTPLLFEVYMTSREVSASARHLWLAFAPALFGGLLLLWLVLVPLGWSLARRVRRREQERAALLAHAVEAQSEERRRIARDLHDGVVQDLAGVALSLASAAERERATLPDRGAALAAAANQTRGSIRALRSLLVEIYPPNLQREGLRSALVDLLEGAAARGLGTHLVYEGDPHLGADVEALLYRVAQEALRNVVAHANAESVTISVGRRDADAVLSVTDDGAGFDVEALAARAGSGHVGLGLLRDLLAEHEGVLELRSAVGEGTELVARVPTS